MAVPSKNFTNIPDGDIDADSPITETLMTQIRDSLIHIEEWLGMDYTAAQNHDHDGVNSSFIAASNLNVLSGEEHLHAEANNEVFQANTTYVKKKEIKLGQVSGTVRVKFELRGYNTTSWCYATVYRNGVPVGTEQAKYGSVYAQFSEDISGWSPNDLLQVYIKSSSTGSAFIKNVKVYTDKGFEGSVIID